jgi:hypothetical protein
MIGNKTFSAGHGGKKARKLDEFIAAMLASPSVEEAAAAVGIGVASAYRWLRDPHVAQRLAEARRDGMQRALARLQANATRAVDNLDELQRSAESEAVRLGASRANLEFALRATEIIDVLERLATIEEKVNGPEWRKNDSPPNIAPAGKGRGVNGRA